MDLVYRMPELLGSINVLETLKTATAIVPERVTDEAKILAFKTVLENLKLLIGDLGYVSLDGFLKGNRGNMNGATSDEQLKHFVFGEHVKYVVTLIFSVKCTADLFEVLHDINCDLCNDAVIETSRIRVSIDPETYLEGHYVLRYDFILESDETDIADDILRKSSNTKICVVAQKREVKNGIISI